jgi:hypothetical protein
MNLYEVNDFVSAILADEHSGSLLDDFINTPDAIFVEANVRYEATFIDGKGWDLVNREWDPNIVKHFIRAMDRPQLYSQERHFTAVILYILSIQDFNERIKSEMAVLDIIFRFLYQRLEESRIFDRLIEFLKSTPAFGFPSDDYKSRYQPHFDESILVKAFSTLQLGCFSAESMDETKEIWQILDHDNIAALFNRSHFDLHYSNIIGPNNLIDPVNDINSDDWMKSVPLPPVVDQQKALEIANILNYDQISKEFVLEETDLLDIARRIRNKTYHADELETISLVLTWIKQDFLSRSRRMVRIISEAKSHQL